MALFLWLPQEEAASHNVLCAIKKISVVFLSNASTTS